MACSSRVPCGAAQVKISAAQLGRSAFYAQFQPLPLALCQRYSAGQVTSRANVELQGRKPFGEKRTANLIKAVLDVGHVGITHFDLHLKEANGLRIEVKRPPGL